MEDLTPPTAPTTITVPHNHHPSPCVPTHPQAKVYKDDTLFVIKVQASPGLGEGPGASGMMVYDQQRRFQVRGWMGVIVGRRPGAGELYDLRTHLTRLAVDPNCQEQLRTVRRT